MREESGEGRGERKRGKRGGKVREERKRGKRGGGAREERGRERDRGERDLYTQEVAVNQCPLQNVTHKPPQLTLHLRAMFSLFISPRFLPGLRIFRSQG